MRAIINEAPQSGTIVLIPRRQHVRTQSAGLVPGPKENVRFLDLFRPVFHWCHQFITISFRRSRGLPQQTIMANTKLGLADRSAVPPDLDRKSTRLNSSHVEISYAVFCLKKKNITRNVCD